MPRRQHSLGDEMTAAYPWDAIKYYSQQMLSLAALSESRSPTGAHSHQLNMELASLSFCRYQIPVRPVR